MQDSLYLAKGGNAHGEANRAIEISLLGVSPTIPATFIPDDRSDLGTAWQVWIDEWFVPVLAPRFAEVHQFASDFQLNEAAAVDLELDQSLPDQLRLQSIKAGALFLEGKSSMKHHPEWSRFASKIESGASPGHAVTLAALQTVLYHLALSPALTAYAWFEFHSGLAGAGIKDIEDNREVFLKITPYLRLAVSANSDDVQDNESNNQLRAI